MTAASQHISTFKLATATWNHTLDPLEPHQNFGSHTEPPGNLHQNLQNHRNPHRTHIGTSGRTGTSGSSRTNREAAPEAAPSFICAETPELALLASICKIFHQQFHHDITLAFSSRALDVHSPPICPIWPRSFSWPAGTLALDVHHPPVWPRSSPQWPAGRSSTRRRHHHHRPVGDISGWLPGRLAP